MNQTSAHKFFRPVLLLFLIFTGLQLFTGALLYLWKMGFGPAQTIEYYFGSERMLELFPGKPDRFLQARTFTGLVKVTLGHFLAYGVLVFFLTHLARSLAGNPSRRLEILCDVFFIVALLEIMSGFMMILTPQSWVATMPALTAFLRSAIFILFTAYTLFFITLLTYLARNRSENNPNTQPRRATLKSFVLGLVLFGGCQSFVSGYSIETYQGSGEAVVRMNNNYLGGSFILPGTLAVYSAQINLQKTELKPEIPDAKKEAETVVSFYGRFYDLDYINIPTGPTLELELDGKVFPFSGAGSAKLRRPYSGDLEETLIQEAAYWHKIPDEVLIVLYKAKVVRIRVRGEKRELSFFATDKNRSNFRRFIRDELPRIFEAAIAR